MIPAEFDEIRPYNPEELPQIYEELIADPEFQAVMGYVFKDIPFEYVAAKMRACKTNLDFLGNYKFYRSLDGLHFPKTCFTVK